MAGSRKDSGALPGSMGAAVKKARLDVPLTQDQLSALSGVSQGHISAVENGDYKRMTTGTLFQLARALELDAVQLRLGRIIRRGVVGEVAADVGALDAELNKTNRAKWIAYGEGLLAAQAVEKPPRKAPVVGLKRSAKG